MYHGQERFDRIRSEIVDAEVCYHVECLKCIITKAKCQFFALTIQNVILLLDEDIISELVLVAFKESLFLLVKYLNS